MIKTLTFYLLLFTLFSPLTTLARPVPIDQITSTSTLRGKNHKDQADKHGTHYNHDGQGGVTKYAGHGRDTAAGTTSDHILELQFVKEVINMYHVHITDETFKTIKSIINNKANVRNVNSQINEEKGAWATAAIANPHGSHPVSSALHSLLEQTKKAGGSVAKKVDKELGHTDSHSMGPMETTWKQMLATAGIAYP